MSDSGETGVLVKLIMILGFMFLLIGALTPGGDSAWATFDTHIQNFPQFDNPFDGERYEINLTYVDDWVQGGIQFPAAITDVANVTHCDASMNPSNATEWWGCLLTQDGNASYVSVNSTRTEFGMILAGATGAAPGLPILAVKITTECRSSTENHRIDYLFYNTSESLQYEIPPGTFFCGFNTFQNVTFLSNFDTPYPIVANTNAGRYEVNPEEPIVSVDFSFIAITLIVGSTTECTGADTLTYIGCIIAGFFNAIIKGLRFLINGIIFTGQLIAYLIGLITAFFAVIAYFLSIPGAPVIVQAIIDVIIIGMIFAVIFIILGKVRGSGSAA